MSVAAEKLTQSYTEQIDAVNKLAAAFAQLDTSTTVQKIEVINKSLKDMQDKMKDSGKTSEKTFQDLGKKVEDVGNLFSKKFPKSLAVGVAALTGFYQGMRNVIALGKSVTGFFASLADGVISVTASIIAIPLKIFTGLVDLAARAGSGMNELAVAMEKLRKENGAFYAPTNKAIIETSKTLTGFKDTGLSTWRVFGTLAERLEHIGELAKEMGATFNIVRKEFEDNGGALLGYQKGLGISNEDMKGVARNAAVMGQKTTVALKDMTKYSYELGNAFQLDAKLISRDMSKAFNDVKHFAGATVKQIAEASTYARKLGLELKEITGTLDAFETFDTAAENVAKLSQSFGVQVDAFKLMEAQDPASQIDMLRKSFASAGVDASNFNRQQLKLLSTTTGLDEATAQAAFSAKNQGIGLDQIKKKGGEAEKKTLTQAQAMSKLADAIERMVKSGGQLSGGFFDMFIKGILGGIQSSPEFIGIIRNIQFALRGVYMIGVQLGRALPKMIPDLGNMLRGLKDFFDPKKFRTLFGGIKDAIEWFMKDKDSNFEGLMDRLRKQFFDFFDIETPAGKKILESFKHIFVKIAKLAADGIKWAADQIKEGLKFVVDLINGKIDLSAGSEAAKGGLGFLANALTPLYESLKYAWKQLAPILWDLVMVLGHKLKEYLKSPEFQKIIRPAIPIIAATLFGPALSRAILTSLTTNLIKSLFSGGGLRSLSKVATSLSSRLGQTAFGRAAGAVAGPVAIVAAAAAIGSGVKKYTDVVTSTMDHSTKVIAAGATGLIDALTLGLLPPDLTNTIANTLGKVVDAIYGAFGKVFGKGFSESMKRYLGAQFELFGSIWDLLGNLFGGSDQAAFDKSVDEVGLAMVRFAATTVEYLFIQLPMLLERLGIRVLGALSGVLVKLTAAALGIITGGIDKAFGTDYTKKLEKISNDVATGLSAFADKQVKEQEKVSEQISNASSRLQDKYLRTTEDKAKIAAQRAASAAKAVADAQNGAATGSLKDTEASIDDAIAHVRSVKALQKELGEKGFDLPSAIKTLKSQFDGVSFEFITPKQAEGLEVSTKSVGQLSEMIASTISAFESITAFPKAAAAAANAIKNDSTKAALRAVSDMIKVANEMDSALSNGALNKIDIKAKLANVAKAVGLGGSATYTVNPSRQVQITVNMTVEMNAADIEKALIMRTSSIIAQRIDFNSNNPTTKVANPISQYVGGSESPGAPVGEASR